MRVGNWRRWKFTNMKNADNVFPSASLDNNSEISKFHPYSHSPFHTIHRSPTNHTYSYFTQQIYK